MSKNIFIHIPKTGGTTINTAMEGTFWQTEPGFHYRHILKDKTSNSGDIFNPENFEQFKDYTIFMMLRHPIDRIISEYYFLQERKEFMDLLKSRPKDIKAYVQSAQTQNYMTGFLKGKRMYDTIPVTEQDLDDVLKSIDNLSIHTGIFEHFNDSLAYFSEKAGIKLTDKIEKKRVTLRRPKLDETPEDIKELILECNALDMKLYQHCLARFKIMGKNSRGNFTFHGDKYDHVIAYAARACFFEFCMNNKTFIKQNFFFFRDLTFYMLNEKNIRDGRQFTIIWNKAFLGVFNKHFPNSKLAIELNSLDAMPEDPLEHSYNIGHTIDEFFSNNFAKSGRYKGMVLDKSFVQ